MEQIKISVKTKDTLPLHLLEPLQGTFKTLSDDNYQKIKKEIITNGFSFSVHVYEDTLSSKIYIIDGHQRYEAMKRMKDEGFVIPQIPVVFIEADNLDHAKRKVLSAASQYGQFNQSGAEEFIKSISGVDLDYLLGQIEIPFVNLDMLNLEDGEKILVSAHEREKTDPNKEWTDMPEFSQEDKTAFRTVIVHFKDADDLDNFFKLINQDYTDKTKSVWHPKQINMETESKRYVLKKAEHNE